MEIEDTEECLIFFIFFFVWASILFFIFKMKNAICSTLMEKVEVWLQFSVSAR